MSTRYESLRGLPAERDLSGTRIESASPTETCQMMALPQDRVAGIVFDVDGTLYNNEPYRRDVARREFVAIGTALNWPVEEAPVRVKQHRTELGQRLGRPARLTETVVDFGLTRDWWNSVREEIYQPEDYLMPDQRISELLGRLSRDYRVAVATNSPSRVAEKILGLLGVDEETRRKIEVLGADNLGSSKPDPGYFTEVARRLGVPSERCLSVGDDEENDAYPAIEAGMGAVVVSNVAYLPQVLDQITHEQEFSPFDLREFTQSQFIPGEVAIIGVTGRAGAGKTTLSGKMVQAYEAMGIPVSVLGLDAFFNFSSHARTQWLEEGKMIGPEEYERRTDQSLWWNFDKAAETLHTLKSGKAVHLQGIYNRADKGELTGELSVNPQPEGHVVIFEGVATAHLNEYTDTTLYVNAHPEVRRRRVLDRDKHRGEEAARERFRVTQRFENRYFAQHRDKADVVVDNSNSRLARVSVVPLL